jgi:Cu(I)/Ag(I) efflux system periplasmic protein CusF
MKYSSFIPAVLILSLFAAQGARAADGEIRKIDQGTGTITIRHGPIPNIDMPPMTMVFQVKNKNLLDQVRPGDKVRFEAEKIAGAYIVTQIETAN